MEDRGGRIHRAFWDEFQSIRDGFVPTPRFRLRAIIRLICLIRIKAYLRSRYDGFTSDEPVAMGKLRSNNKFPERSLLMIENKGLLELPNQNLGAHPLPANTGTHRRPATLPVMDVQ